MDCWDRTMDILRIIIPVITFILGYCLSRIAQKKEWHRNNEKDLFFNFFVKFVRPYTQLYESSDIGNFTNYSDDEKSNIFNLLEQYEILLPKDIQHAIRDLHLTMISFKNEEDRINYAFETLVALIISKYKELAASLGYSISVRLQ